MSDFGKETIKCLDALESAYQKGRADLLMPYDVESVEELIENVQKKVRADAIEECYMKAKTMMEELDYCGGRMNGKTHRMYCMQALEFLRQVAMKLKEQKE